MLVRLQLPLVVVVFLTATIFFANPYVVHAQSVKEIVTIRIHLQPGWNLVSMLGFHLEGLIYRQGDGAQAAFLYSPYEKEYIRIFPEEYSSKELERRLRPYYGDAEKDPEAMQKLIPMMLTSIWVYSATSRTYTYGIYDEIDFRRYGGSFPQGWNFMAVQPEFIGKNLNDFFGECSLEKAYTWNNSTQSWNRLDFNQVFSENRGPLLWEGFLLKFGSPCVRKIITPSPATPPSLPE